MLITFQSSASGDVTMFGDVAAYMIALMGKEPGSKGIITVEELPAALCGLKRSGDSGEQTAAAKRNGIAGSASVTSSQRAFPLIELLEWSLKRRVPVVWGV